MEKSKSGSAAGTGRRTQSTSATQPEVAPLQPSLSDQTSDIASQGASAAEAARSLDQDVKETAKAASRAVKQQASQFASSAGDELAKAAENQKTRGVEAIQCFARAISSAAAELETQSPQVARSMRDAANKVEDLSDNLSSHSIDQLLKSATDLARQQPVLFIGGAVAAGFAFSRFLKSSASNREAVGAASNRQRRTL